MSGIVLITGATSGIGEACARVFARSGYDLILNGRRRDRLKTLGDELERQHGVNTHLLAFDVSESRAVSDAINSLPEKWRAIDLLVNNAGLALGLSAFPKGDLQDWETMIDTNVKGLLYVSRAVASLMVERKKGHVINIGSIAGKETYPNGNVYCATKHAVDSLTRAMRMDMLPHGIKVTSVNPGAVETEFSVVRFHGDAEKAGSVYKGFEPLSAGDVAETVYFAASRPSHVNINDMTVMPAAQANATLIRRNAGSK